MRDGYTHPKPNTQAAWVSLGRQRQRLAHAIYARDAALGCYFCHLPVDQTLPPTHPKSRTAHHIVELQDGGPLDDIDNMALAHRDCNTIAGQARLRARLNTPPPMHIDPTSL